MANRDDIPRTDPSEIEALIQRLKQSNLEPRDAQLVERLLRLVLSMASLLQHQNASIKRLKQLIFGPSSDNRAATGNMTEEEGKEASSVTISEAFDLRRQTLTATTDKSLREIDTSTPAGVAGTPLHRAGFFFFF